MVHKRNEYAAAQDIARAPQQNVFKAHRPEGHIRAKQLSERYVKTDLQRCVLIAAILQRADRKKHGEYFARRIFGRSLHPYGKGNEQVAHEAAQHRLHKETSAYFRRCDINRIGLRRSERNPDFASKNAKSSGA
jgi:hypothetical protein